MPNVSGLPQPTTTTPSPSNQPTTTTPCSTISGPDPNSECIFPFIYAGKSWTVCTTSDGDHNPWCPTHIEDDGTFTKGGRMPLVKPHWGYCHSSCPNMKGKRCNPRLRPSDGGCVLGCFDGEWMTGTCLSIDLVPNPELPTIAPTTPPPPSPVTTFTPNLAPTTLPPMIVDWRDWDAKVMTEVPVVDGPMPTEPQPFYFDLQAQPQPYTTLPPPIGETSER